MEWNRDAVSGCVGLKKSVALGGGRCAQILKGIDLSIKQAEWVAIVGPSGSGKSTLLHCLAGNTPPTEGKVMLAGVDLAHSKPQSVARLHRERVGFIFQKYNLIPYLTAEENIRLLAQLGKKRLTDASVSSMLDSLGLSKQAKLLAANLSGGEQQRVAIGRVLLAQPRVVFADEPTGALDSTASSVAMSLLQQITQSGASLISVTHDLELAAQADRVVVIRDGRLIDEPGDHSPPSLRRSLAG